MDELDDRTYPIREDMAFQRRSWRMERAGWILIALVTLAALAGVFFHGPVSYARVRNTDNSWAVEYERFAHKTVVTHFTLRAAAPVADQILIRLSPAFAETHDIESIQPPPSRASGGTYGLELVFARSGAGDVAIRIAARPRRFGIMSLHIEAEGRGSLNVFQLIYP